MERKRIGGFEMGKIYWGNPLGQTLGKKRRKVHVIGGIQRRERERKEN